MIKPLDDHAKFHQLLSFITKKFSTIRTTNWFLIFARRSLIERNWIFSFFLSFSLTHAIQILLSSSSIWDDRDDDDDDATSEPSNSVISFHYSELGWSIILPCSLLEALASLWMGWLEDSQSARRKEIEAEQQQQQQQKTRWKDRFSLKRSRPATEKRKKTEVV